MTGLAASFGNPGAQSVQTVRHLLSEMRHRSRDGEAVESYNEATFGIAYTAKLPEDTQAPEIWNTDEWLIIADARLDNRAELTAQLCPEGEVHSDCRLLYLAIEYWTDEAPRHLRGDFAFVALNKATGTILACRDPFGIRPLFFRVEEGVLSFSTEARGLINLAIRSPRLNISDVRISHTISAVTGNGSKGGEAEIRGLYRVQPGHLLVKNKEELTEVSYFKLRPAELAPDPDWPTEFRRRFEDAVESRLRTKGKLATLLSGGLDSSAITAAAARQSAKNFCAVAGIFKEKASGDEEIYIEAVGNHLGLDVLKVPLDEVSPIKAMQSIIAAMGRPFNAPGIAVLDSLLPHISKSGAMHYLDGHGGDEVISYGFDKLIELGRQKKWLELWKQMPAWSGLFGTSQLFDFARFFLRFSTLPGTYRLRRTLLSLGKGKLTDPGRLVKEKFAGNLPAKEPIGKTALERHVQSIQNGLLCESFELYDVVASRHGLQPLFPFFDQRLVEFCLAVPDDLKLHNGHTRYLMREAMQSYLPSKVLWRRSKFDFTPVLRRQLAPWQKETDLNDDARSSPLLNILSQERITSFLKKCQDTHRLKSEDAQLLWRIISLDYWLKTLEKEK